MPLEMRPYAVALALVAAALIAPGAAHAITVVVPDVSGGAQNLRVTSLGGTTALTVGYVNHVVGPGGAADEWMRPIIQFPVSSFASLAGLSVVSATLHYSIITDFTEPGESATSEVRLFTTLETELNWANRNLFAGLSGDGGAHTVVGSASFVDGVTGAQSLAFSAASLNALESAINGADPTLVISFREFAVTEGIDRVDFLDEFVLGIPPGNMSIEVTAVPEPTTLSLLLSFFACVRPRRCSRPRWFRQIVMEEVSCPA